MTKIRRTTVAALAALALTAPLTACNRSVPSTCDAFSLTVATGGKGGKSTTKTKPKTKPKSGVKPPVVVHDDDDDCDDD